MFRVVLLLTVLQLTIFVSCRNPKHDAEPIHGKDSEEETSREVVKNDAAGSECMIGRKIFVVNATEKVSWFRSYFYCQDKKMDLPIISNAEEHQQLINTIKLHEGSIEDVGVWTSGYYDTDDNEYRWMTRLTPMNYTVWRPGRPGTSDNLHKCVELRKSHQYKMNDVSCMQDNFVACQTQEKSWGKCQPQ